jgi:hypothetical protein
MDTGGNSRIDEAAYGAIFATFNHENGGDVDYHSVLVFEYFGELELHDTPYPTASSSMLELTADA